MPSQGVTNAANAIINKINNLISSHNSNGNAHQDIRNSIPKIFYAACDCSEQNALIELECEDWNTEQGNIIYVRFNNVDNHDSTYVMSLNINEETIPVHNTIDFYNNITPLTLFRDAVVKFTCYFIDENTPIFLYEFPTLTSELYNDSGFITISSVPSASSATPLSDTQNGGVGTGTTWARSDHTHPKSSLYAEASHTHQDVLKKSNTVGLVKNDGTIDTNTFNLDTLDCINENFTLLSLPQIIITYNKLSFNGEETQLLTNYSEGAYVDWGDGTPIETYESTNTLEHDYSDNVQEHTITIYGNILNLYNNSFKNLTGMTSINIPSSVTSLGNSCFFKSGLTSVTIPNGVRSLGIFCFNGCTGLTSVVIPSSVISLGGNCFSGCTNLVDYQLYWETPLVNWSSTRMPNNTDTYFTIPNGTTANYTAKGFPSDKLVERSE